MKPEQLRATVEILQGEKESRTRPFRMLANTGQPFERYFGRAVVDLSGVEPLPGRGLPMLLNHRDDDPAGVATGMEQSDAGIVLTGDLLLRQPAGLKVSELSDDGFPLTGSLGVKVLVREEVVEGASVEVNGETVNGPIEIWRKSVLTETSFVTANPADPDTQAEALGAQSPEEGQMEKLQELLKAVPEEWHGLAARMFAEGSDLQAIEKAVCEKRLETLAADHVQELAKKDSEIITLREQAAAAVVPASDDAETLAQLKKDSGHPGVTLATSDTPPEDRSKLPLEERCRLDWNDNPTLRSEFLNNFRAYVALMRREGVTA